MCKKKFGASPGISAKNAGSGNSNTEEMRNVDNALNDGTPVGTTRRQFGSTKKRRMMVASSTNLNGKEQGGTTTRQFSGTNNLVNLVSGAKLISSGGTKNQRRRFSSLC